MATAFKMSCSAFGMLLVVYPREFREQFREEMMLIFAEQLRAACQRRGLAAGLAEVWRIAGWEAICVALPLQLRNPVVTAAVLAILVSSALTLTFFRAVSPCAMHP